MAELIDRDAQTTQTNTPNALETLDCVSRQKAINTVERMFLVCDEGGKEEYRDLMVEALKVLPTAQPEPSQIARDIATIIENEQDMRVILAQPQRMRGRWIEYPEVLTIADALDDTYIGCSCCKNVFNILDNDTERFLFCPNCGADMRGGNT